MKSKLLIGIIMTGMLLSSTFSLANEKTWDDKKEHAEEKMDDFMDAVDATDMQKQQLQTIHDKYWAQKASVVKDLMGKEKEMTSYIFSPESNKGEALRRYEDIMKTKERLGEIMMEAAFEKKAVLTPEQQKEAREFFEDQYKSKLK